MSVIDIEIAKSYLDIIHDEDDVKLQMLLDGAEDEALQFMDRKTFTSLCTCAEVSSEGSEPDVVSEAQIPASVVTGVLVLLEAAYQASPENVPKMRLIAEKYLFPFRCNLGV